MARKTGNKAGKTKKWSYFFLNNELHKVFTKE
jgi:hypothetical protein